MLEEERVNRRVDGWISRKISLLRNRGRKWKYLDQSRSFDERGVAISGARIRSMEDSSKPGRRKAATAFNYQPLIINQFLLYAKCLTRGIFLLSLSKPPLSDRFILLRPSLWPIVTRMIILHPGRGWFPSNFFFTHPFLERHFYSVGEKDKREREKDRYRSWEGKLVYSNQGNYLKGRRRRNRKIFWKVGKWKEKQCRWQVAPRQPAAATPTTSD